MVCPVDPPIGGPGGSGRTGGAGRAGAGRSPYERVQYATEALVFLASREVLCFLTSTAPLPRSLPQKTPPDACGQPPPHLRVV